MLTVKIVPAQNPPGKLADAELHFAPFDLSNLAFLNFERHETAQARIRDIVDEATQLRGLKLIGFGVWETRDGRRNVTFPARQYSVNGERRSFALLRPIDDGSVSERIKQFILDAYDAHIAACDAEAPAQAPFA